MAPEVVNAQWYIDRYPAGGTTGDTTSDDAARALGLSDSQINGIRERNGLIYSDDVADLLRGGGGGEKEGGEMAGLSGDALAMQMDIARRQIAIAEAAEQRSAKLYKYWGKTFKPIEERLAAGAAVGLDPDYYAGRAATDVGSAFDKATAIEGRNQMRLGVDPNSPRFSANARALTLARAASEAGARTNARRYAADTTYNRRLNAVNIGRNLPSTSAGMLGQASGALSGASGATGSALSYLNSQAALAQNAEQFAANMAFRQMQYADMQQAQQYGGIGSLLGMGAGALAGNMIMPGVGGIVGGALLGGGLGGGIGENVSYW